MLKYEIIKMRFQNWTISNVEVFKCVQVYKIISILIQLF